MAFVTYHTSAPYGALISINVMNVTFICRYRTAISLSLCKIQEIPRLES